MSTPFSLHARAEHHSAAAGRSTLWAALRIDPIGPGLERERAPLAVALVVDVSGSMAGDPLAHAIASCEVVASLLGEQDQLAIVTFSPHAGVRCGLTTVDAAGRALIAGALRGIAADANTNLHGGLEVGAGVLAVAKPGLRRVMVLLSDGRPNVGLASPEPLAAYTRSLGLAVSTLGFGPDHDDAVLDAIAIAGSGRYSYVPDPRLARVDLARAALAHGGIVATELELSIALGEGVELVRILPPTTLRHRATAVVCSVGDIFRDEGRVLALELRLDLGARLSRGHLATVTLSGVAADGTRHSVTASLDIDLHAGPHAPDPEAQRDVVLVQVDGARAAARDQAQRGQAPAAAALLRAAVARIDALAGFVQNDGSPLAELREQIADEAANYASAASARERVHQDKASRTYKTSVASVRHAAPPPGPPAFLVASGGPLDGQRVRLLADMTIGRGASAELCVPSGSLSRAHARILWSNGAFVLQDLGSTNGSLVNGARVEVATLAHGDRIALGEQVLVVELPTR